MLNESENTAKIAGVKQVRRALADSRVKQLFVAQDADPHLTQPLERQAEEQGVPIDRSCTMKALGAAFGIAVGAAVAAVVSA